MSPAALESIAAAHFYVFIGRDLRADLCAVPATASPDISLTDGDAKAQPWGSVLGQEEGDVRTCSRARWSREDSVNPASHKTHAASGTGNGSVIFVQRTVSS